MVELTGARRMYDKPDRTHGMMKVLDGRRRAQSSASDVERVVSQEADMNIDEALKITGFKLCEFKANEGDTCDTCDKEMKAGDNVYYERTSYECDEGNYHCKDCVIAKPGEWAEQADYYEKLGKELYS